MNARTLLLLASAAVNLALGAAFVFHPTLAPPALRALFESRASREATAAAAQAGETRARILAAARSAKLAAASQAKLWSALQSDDLRALVERLRSAGFPASVVRAVVTAEVDNRFAARMKALQAQLEETPYWRPAPTNSFNNPKFFEERQQAYRDRAKVLREVLGDQALAIAGLDPTALQRQQFGDLPQAKIELVQRINDDYAEMTSQIRAAANGILLPDDRAKLALLEREKRADLAAVLTPRELEDYEMRSSPVTMRLRGAMSLIDATEDEFRTIYRINLPYAEILYPSSTTGVRVFTADMQQQREQAQQAVNTQLKAALGDARYTELMRAQNYEFQQLARLTQRENLPLAAAIRAFDLRASTTEASARIGDNPALTVDQKLAALRDLAQNTRNQISATLGPAVGPTYARTADWLQAIERGHIVTFTPDGMGTMFRMVSSPQPPPPPR